VTTLVTGEAARGQLKRDELCPVNHGGKRGRRLAGEVEVRSGHVVPLLAAGGEILNGRKEMVQEIEGRFAGVAAADVLDAIDSKLLVMEIASVAETICEKQERITRFQFQQELVVARCGE
jgi:hypothetical protein